MKRRDFNKALFASTAGVLTINWKDFSAKKYVPPLACQTKFENIDAVKAAGGSFIGSSVGEWLDPDGPEDEFLARVAKGKSASLPIKICNGFIRPKHLHATGPEANHDELMVYIEEVFRRAQRANVHMINFGSGGSRKIPEGYDYETAMDQFIALLKRIGPLAAKYDLTVGVEQLRHQECNFINRISEVERVVRGANHPNIKAVADFYHMVTEGDTPADLKKVTDILMHVEIAELIDRRMPGTTNQDFKPYMSILKKAKYKGAISVEGRYEVSELANGFATITKQWLEA
ncbi:Sugar phosphate isomerase/epimerase [Spirosomataceae bacterium TFI 002]|nr:Sugar phosphate isomerase/epimerase [Spirosomataceae bacterium TFI 002]